MLRVAWLTTRELTLHWSQPLKRFRLEKGRRGVRNTCVPDFFARFADPFLVEATDFVICCLNGIKPRVSLEATRNRTQVRTALRESFHSGSVVRIKSQF